MNKYLVQLHIIGFNKKKAQLGDIRVFGVSQTEVSV